MKLDNTPLTAAVVAKSQNQLEFEDNAGVESTTNIIESTKTADSDCNRKPEPFFVTLGTTFITIFLAEIGDKTQLSTLLMSAESHAPWVVFMGSAAALISTSLLGVLLGSWIACKLSPKTVERAAGVMLLLISVMLFWDVFLGK